MFLILGLQRLIAFWSVSISKVLFLIKIQATRLVQNSKEKQVSHYNGKKSIFSINTTHFENLEKQKENIIHINLSFLQAYIFK